MAAAKRSAMLGLMEEIHKWGAMKPNGVTLRSMLEFGGSPHLLHSSHFLHHELPIRIARRVIELDSLPYGLDRKSPVLRVKDWYLESFRDLRSFPLVKDDADELEFTQMIKRLKVRSNNVVPMMALGVHQLKKDLNCMHVYEELGEIHEFLDRFCISRIGICMLIGQHLALHDPNPPPDSVGCIHTKMSPVEVAKCAAEDARAICFRHYGTSPDISIHGNPGFTFPYVSSHLHLMVYELVKNSLRAVQEKFMDSEKVPPPVNIVVADGLEDVTIKISDEGGGIPRSGLPRLFTYLYTTANSPLHEQSECDVGTSPIMAGYGFGLPTIRLYARYFGGDLQIISMEGYGTDAYLHLSRLGDAQEPLP